MHGHAKVDNATRLGTYARWTKGETGQLYLEGIVLLGLSIASCAAVVVAILWSFIQGRPTTAESNRDRHVRRTWDLMVLILMVLELFQSLNWLAGTVISHHLFNLEDGNIDESRRSLLHTLCKHIGAFTYCLDLLLYFWNASLAYSIYSWVVRQTLVRHLRMRMTAHLVLLLLMSVALTLVPALREDFGALPGVVCWLRTLELTNPSVVLNKLVILPVCWSLVGYCYAHTVLHLWRHSRDTSLPVPHAYRSLTTRLLLLASVFFIAWLLNSIWYMLLSFNLVNLPLGIVGTCYYGVGLLDAVIYGHPIWTRMTARLAESRSTDEGTIGPRGSVSPAKLPARLGLHLHLNSRRVFVTTLNCGRCLRPRDLGRLDEWAPQYGYDIYVFGFQECRMLKDLRRAIHQHLGGSDAFILFEQVLGYGPVWNDQVVLFVFARAHDVERSMFKVADVGRGYVNNGIKFGFGRYHNKGAVGLAFDYCGTSVAFITAHFASDSAGIEYHYE